MSYDANISNPRIQKHTLLTIQPRIKVVGAVLYNTPLNIYSLPWPYVVTSMNGAPGVTPMNNLGVGGAITDDIATAINADSAMYYDNDNKILYFYSFDDPATSPQYMEFLLNISDKEFTGPYIPNEEAPYVEWIPALDQPPAIINGARDSLYGFTPTQQTTIKLLNNDGWLDPILYAASFNLAPVFCYHLANDEYEDGLADADVQMIFRGYVTSQLNYQAGAVTITITDIFGKFDANMILTEKYLQTNFPNCDPEACVVGQEWYVRRVYGMIDGFRPVNLDSDGGSPTTSNNRIWGCESAFLGGTVTSTIDAGAANTTTKTFFTGKPQFNVGDRVRMIHSVGSSYSVEINTVDRTLNFITHTATGSRTVTAGDTTVRSPIGRVDIKDRDGNIFNLMPVDHYNESFNCGFPFTPVLGFILENNFEAAISITHSPFDPSQDTIIARVYGPSLLPEYVSTNPIGAISDNGGIAAQAVTILANIMALGNVIADQIDENTFTNVGANSHSLGIQIPYTYNGQPPTIKDAVTKILNSMLWNLVFVESNGSILIGLRALEPFQTEPNYTASDDEHGDIQFTHDYSGLYSDVLTSFMQREITLDGTPWLSPSFYNNFHNLVASNDAGFMHQVVATFSPNDPLLHYVDTEAQVITNRLAIALGDRRGYYAIVLGNEFLNKTNPGATYALESEHLAGFPFVPGNQNQRQGVVIEVQKSSRSATITLEDQKGVEDNAGSW